MKALSIMSAYYKVFKKYTYIYINRNKTLKYCNTVDMERFAGLNICGFNPIEVFKDILSSCLGQKCLYIIKERHLYSQKTFMVATLENCEDHKSLVQQIFPHLW